MSMRIFFFFFFYFNGFTNARKFNDYFVKRQNFALDTGYYSYLNKCIYNLQSYYDTSRQKKKTKTWIL